jgi:hypothetical protein
MVAVTWGFRVPFPFNVIAVEARSLARTESKAFKALVDRCAQEIIYEQVLALARKHEGVIRHAFELFIGLALRRLQSIGQCLPVDARNILKLSRPTVTDEVNNERPTAETDPEQNAALLAGIDDVIALYFHGLDPSVALKWCNDCNNK